MQETSETIIVGQGRATRVLAARRRPGASPGLFWLGGFRSDMGGTKAQALDAWAKENGRACLRFDYSGHGESEGRFEDGTIGRWAEEARAVFDTCAGPQIVVGSSMGGWIALLLARSLRERPAAAPLAGLVLVAPAADFTEALMWRHFTPEIRAEIDREGRWMYAAAEGGDAYPITRALIEDGRQHLMLGGLIEPGCPVTILQGMKDDAVPWEHAMATAARMPQDDVTVSLIPDGDHRLSRPQDIARLIAAVKSLSD